MAEIFAIISNKNSEVKEKIAAIQELLEKDGKPIDNFVGEEGGEGGRTPLIKAIIEGESVELLQFLIDIGSDVNLWDEYGRTPIFHAAINGNDEAIRCLLENGADATIANFEDKQPLAAYLSSDYDDNPCDINIVSLLLEKCDVNNTDRNGWTAIMYPARQGRLDLFKLLLDHGANVCARNAFDYSPLEFAVTRNGEDYLEIVKILIQRGVDLNYVSKRHGNILNLCSHDGANHEMKKLLIENGVDINVPDPSFGETLLQSALFYNDVETVKVLLDYGADITALNDNVLISACQYNQYEMVKLLVDLGFDLDCLGMISK